MAAASSHGVGKWRPLVYGGRVYDPRLKERPRKDGSMAYGARLRIDGADRTITFRDAHTPTDAVQAFVQLLAARDQGTAGQEPDFNPTLAWVADEWIAHCRRRADADRLAPNTVRLRRRVLDLWILPTIGPNKQAASVRAADARRMLDRLSADGLAPSTQTSALSIFALLMGYAVRHDYASGNPVRELTPDERPGSRRRKEPRYLTDDETARLLAAAEPPWRTLIAAMVYAGLRVSEALGLRWKDVDMDAGTLTVAGQYAERDGYRRAKTPSSHATLTLFPALARELAAQRARQAQANIALIGPEQYVFARPATARPWANAYARRRVVEAAKRAGLNEDTTRKTVAAHDLRHSFVAQAFRHGAPHPEVTEAARHAHAAITLRAYGGLTTEDRGRAARRMLEGGFGA